MCLHDLADFIDDLSGVNSSPPDYFYEGKCPQTGELLRLPRTNLVEAIARSLMGQLGTDEVYNREGKMYGVLLVELPDGKQKVLKAFSGLLNGLSVRSGWVPPIPGREELIFDETLALTALEEIKQEIVRLKRISERQEYISLQQEFSQQLERINLQHQQRKQERQQQREIFQQSLTGEALEQALAELENASRQDGIERKLWKRSRNQKILPLQQVIFDADEKIQKLKQQRKQLSRQLQTKMHATYTLMNFLGQSQSLQQINPQGLPTGTGDCCAPKLLDYAAKNQLKPLAMAEFWWGKASNSYQPGNFYSACLERCQPIMGFLLSGLNQLRLNNQFELNQAKRSDLEVIPSSFFLLPSSFDKLPIIYSDDFLIVVNKPANLLSVPGRYLHTQDSVLSRLRNLYQDGENFLAIHRLDQETSGILLIARNPNIHRQISQQFQNRTIRKTYIALLAGQTNQSKKQNPKNPLELPPIELPLWGNPENRPYQEVNWSLGKPSITYVKVIETQEKHTRVQFHPITGRTHQLRVHAAHPQGLGTPIMGDKLYGQKKEWNCDRLFLHAQEIEFFHPELSRQMRLIAPTPF